MTKTAPKPKLQLQAMFDLLVAHCQRVKGFDASPAELSLIRKAFDGAFDKAQTKARKTAPSWCGYVRNDGSIDEAARLQCLQSAFCRLLHFHAGRNGAYLGTIINAMDNLGSMAQAFGLCPHPASETRWYKYADGSPEAQESRRKSDENRKVERHFADVCDTFCQVFVFIASGKQESSVPGAEWRRVMYGQ